MKHIAKLNPPSLSHPSLPVPAQPTYLSDFKTPGADLKGIFYLRNVVDADAIVAAIGPAKEKGGRVS